MSDEVIIDIPLAQLHDSPFNPRTMFNEAKLLEMAETMRPPLGRVQQPIVVRPVQLRPLLAGADTFDDYQIVFGHRRRRAAELAGLDKIRAIVRSMTDEEVKRAQIVENLQREDVHPIEEAEGFDKLMREHGISADQIAEQTGSSRSYVYGRLKLLQACPPVRKACLEGKVDAEVALLIARLRTEKLQAKALARIEGKYWSLEDGGKKSYRNIRDLLKEEFTLDLKGALFDVTAADLLHNAGACVTCPKRSCNAPEFADLLVETETSYGRTQRAEPNLCTDPDCFAAKKAAHLQREASKLKAEGAVVIEGNKARAAIDAQGNIKGAYIALKDAKAQCKASYEAGGQANMIDPASVVLIQDPRTGKTEKAVHVDTLKSVGVKVADPKQRQADTWQEQQKRDAEKRKKREAAAALKSERNLALLHQVREAISRTERSAFDLSLVARTTLAGVNYQSKGVLAKLWNCGGTDALEKRLGSMSVPDLTLLMMDCALVDDVNVGFHNADHDPEALLAAAKHYGVEVQTPAPAPSTPPPAAQAAKGAASKASTGKRTAQYKNASTGETWSGRGLQPKWLKVAIAAGKTLADFEVSTPPPAGARPKIGKSLRELLAEKAKLTGQADLIAAAEEQPGPSGQEVKVEAGFAGHELAAIKTVMASQPDRFRAPYGSKKVDAGVTAGGGVAQPVAIEEAGA